uniref:Minichromosome loss protein Mcl1 middle region domain-containing protein n=3 Tax=Parascaris univalens TaxID=6257 RepID=A0A915BBD1_PARUN
RLIAKMSGGEFSEPRLLHSIGFIDLCVNKSRRTSSVAFLSSGTDGDIWLWNEDPLEDAEYEPRNVQGRTHHSLAWHDENIYVGHTLIDARTGVEKAVVSRFSLNDFVASAPLISFSLDVTSLDVSSDGNILVAGAIDHILKVIQLESGNYVRLECEGQIMCVRIDPNGELLAVSASDGILRIYPIAVVSGASPIRSIRISSRIPDIDPGQPRLEISWAVDGTYLFSVVLGGVKRFKRETFDDPSSFIASSSVTEMFSTCCISSCGKFVAASSMGGTICVWNVESGELLSSCKYVRLGETKVITSMIWHPILYGTLFFADSEEHICSLSNCVKEPISNSDSSDHPSKKKLFDSDDDTRLSADLGAIKKSYGFDDEGVHITEKSPPPDERPFVPLKMLESAAPYEPPRVPGSFVSGSSPTHLSQRYLKWNQFGMVTSFSTTEENTIEVRWHDASVHSEMIIDNSTSRYSIADLSNEWLC